VSARPTSDRIAWIRPWFGRLAQWAAASALVVTPLVCNNYTNTQLSLVACFSVAILGLDLLVGRTGLVSLGHGAFFGLGAYATAVATVAGWPAPAVFLAACMVPAGVGVLLGLPALRLGGVSLAMVTLALPIVAVPLAKRLGTLTGGSTGISANPLLVPDWTGLAPDQWTLYVLIVVAGIMFLLARNLLRGRLGHALALIRTSEALAVSVGVPVYRTKLLVFTAAALFAGVAGYMYVCAIGFLSPETLSLLVGLNLLIALVIGGMRSPIGAVVGGAFNVFLPEIASGIGATQPGAINIVTGGSVLLIVFLARDGLAGLLSRAWYAMTTQKATGAADGTHRSQP
jgi:branched-chain amino acid transport system permease protein